jgi:hypothetical protein
VPNKNSSANRPLYPRFVIALLTGSSVAMPKSSATGALSGWSTQACNTVIDEARRQLDDQKSSLDRTLSRAQFLFTTLLGLVAVVATATPHIWANSSWCWPSLIPKVLFISGGCLLVIALLGATAVIAVRKNYEGVSAAVLSRWHTFDVERLAREYAECVDLGEHTGNAHLTVFGTAVRFTLYGALCFGVAWVLATTL